MTTPQRLLDGDGDDFELVLLASAGGDEPSRAATARALVAIGLGAGVATAATAATGAAATGATALSPSATGAGAASAAGTAAATIGKAGLPVLVKWVGIATVGGLGTWGVVEEVRTHETPAPVIAAVAPAAQRLGDSGANTRAQTQQQRADTRGAAAAVPVEEGAALSEAPAASSVPASASARGSAPTLADEIAALDRARSAMQRDPNAALAELATYNSRFPRGALGQEASVMRIEALAAAGRRDEARARANAFIAGHPNSPYAQRVRSVLEPFRLDSDHPAQ